MLIARAVQGAGGGALQPLSQSILLESFPPQKRGLAMAVFALGVVVAPVLGPTLGGWLTDSYSWRWAFYINIPVGILAVFMISRYVHDPSYIQKAKPGKLDGIGLGLLAVWLGACRSFSTRVRKTTGSARPGFAGRLCDLGHLSCRIFDSRASPQEATRGSARLPPSKLRTWLCADRPVRSGHLRNRDPAAALLSGTDGLHGLDRRLGGQPARRRCNYRHADHRLSHGQNRQPLPDHVWVRAVWHCAASGSASLTLSIGQWTFLWAIIISGFASGCVFVPLSTTTMAILKNEEIGNASGLYNLLRNIGGSIGISVVNTIVARHEQLHRSELVHSLDPGRVEVQGAIRGMQGYLTAQGSSPTDALHRSYGLLAQGVNAQARLWSYVDDFRYMALVSFGCIPIVFALKKSVGRKGAIGAGH